MHTAVNSRVLHFFGFALCDPAVQMGLRTRLRISNLHKPLPHESELVSIPHRPLVEVSRVVNFSLATTYSTMRIGRAWGSCGLPCRPDSEPGGGGDGHRWSGPTPPFQNDDASSRNSDLKDPRIDGWFQARSQIFPATKHFPRFCRFSALPAHRTLLPPARPRCTWLAELRGRKVDREDHPALTTCRSIARDAGTGGLECGSRSVLAAGSGPARNGFGDGANLDITYAKHHQKAQSGLVARCGELNRDRTRVLNKKAGG